MFESDVQFADTAVGGGDWCESGAQSPSRSPSGSSEESCRENGLPDVLHGVTVNVLGSEDREPRQAKPPPKLCTTLNIKIQMEARSSQTSVSWSGRMAVPAPLSPDRGLATRIGRRLTRSEGRRQLIRAR
jgi:hypothetical protein